MTYRKDARRNTNLPKRPNAIIAFPVSVKIRAHPWLKSLCMASGPARSIESFRTQKPIIVPCSPFVPLRCFPPCRGGAHHIPCPMAHSRADETIVMHTVHNLHTRDSPQQQTQQTLMLNNRVAE